MSFDDKIVSHPSKMTVHSWQVEGIVPTVQGKTHWSWVVLCFPHGAWCSDQFCSEQLHFYDFRWEHLFSSYSQVSWTAIWQTSDRLFLLTPFTQKMAFTGHSIIYKWSMERVFFWFFFERDGCEQSFRALCWRGHWLPENGHSFLVYWVWLDIQFSEECDFSIFLFHSDTALRNLNDFLNER